MSGREDDGANIGESANRPASPATVRHVAKGNEGLDEREALAAKTMREVYGPTWKVTPRDVSGAPPRTHDFDLTDGSVVVGVEVSTIAEQATVDDSERWSRFFPDLTTQVPGLASGWLISAYIGGNPRRLLRGLATWLADLEGLGQRSVWTDRWQAYAFEPAELRPPEFATLYALAAVGVRSAAVVDELPPGRCHVVLEDDGFSWSPTEDTYFSDFVSEQLAGPHASDVAKAEGAGADRWAVFLWLHALSHFDVIRRLDNDLLGGELTDTGTLDEVWIGRSLQNGDVIAYRWRPGESWVVFEVSSSDEL